VTDIGDEPTKRVSLAPGAVSGTAAHAPPDTEAHPAAEEEGHHADVSGGWLRPAVFGAMDGLVTNIALIAGVGGGGVSPHSIILTGAAGLVAGAISMGLGEYTSVRTQNEQVEHEVAKERRELEHNPAAEARELAERWIKRGLPPELAHEVATTVGRDIDQAVRVHAQEELGIDPHETPSPWTAAISSFLCFSAGALVPLLPYLFGVYALWLALLAGAIGLFVAGVLTAWFTNRPWWSSGLRQLVFGIAAAGITFMIGKVIGAGAGVG
jgi:VIT1/CCC1 family predicted Fe2+/Mn2+ transporter